MVQRFLMVSLLWMLAVGRCCGDDVVKNGLAELEGTWTLVKVEIHGKSLLKKDDTSKLIIKDGSVTNAPKGATELSKILDPSKTPKAVTLPYEEAVFYGIYEVMGDELRVCGDGVDTATEKNPEARRPKEFDSTKGLLLVFKREKM
jgi:uncharacterized protein (TIGR03067 family)